MDASGTRIFDNDAAIGWAEGLATRDDLWLVRDALRAVIYTDCFLDVDRASEGLAACEVIARLKGHWGVRDESTAAADRWVEAHPQPVPDELVTMAAEAIDRTLTPESELPLVWKDAGSLDDWQATMADLRRRVTA
ncbi:MAG: DUF4259 domain-containing protein [Planctomycetaceae bacterium]